MNLDNVVSVRKTKTIYRDGDRCIKMFEPGYSKADILNEALNQARVEETGFDIPAIIEVTTQDGQWAIVSEFIEGDTLQDLMDKHPEKMDEYLELFVDLQIRMHSLKSPSLNKLKDKMNRKMGEANIDATTRYELRMRLESMPNHDKLCHGDFNPSNIIIDKEGVPHVIDWSHATQGNASADVARTYLLFCLKGNMPLAKKYLNLFCKKSNTARQYVEKWMPIVAASQSVKGNEAEREFLLSWVNVVEYE